MKTTHSNPSGHVASLHLHPLNGGEEFQSVQSIEVECSKGIVANPRYFERKSRSGDLSKRQVSLIEREQISEHAATLGLEIISPETIRSNIETSGINLESLIGHEVQIGKAILFFYEARTGCSKMDAICLGLRELTKNNQLGVLAQVVQSGRIEIGDEISVATKNPDSLR